MWWMNGIMSFAWPSAANLKRFPVAEKQSDMLEMTKPGLLYPCTQGLSTSQCHLTRSGTGWRTSNRTSRSEDGSPFFCVCSICCLRILIKLSVWNRRKTCKRHELNESTEIVLNSLPTSCPQSQTIRSFDESYVDFRRSQRRTTKLLVRAPDVSISSNLKRPIFTIMRSS